MKILVLGASGGFYAERLQKVAESRGHVFDMCSARDLCVEVGPGSIHATVNGEDVFSYDVIHPVSLVANRWPWCATLLYAQEKFQTQIIDRRNVDAKLGEYSGLSKYFIEHDEAIPFPKTFSFKRIDDAERAMSEGMFSYPVILKNTSSKKGRGVLLASDMESIRDFVSSTLAEDNTLGFVLREFIPNDGDYRVNVIGGKVVAVFKRTPMTGEFRSNISQGGTLAFVPSETVPEVCRVALQITQLVQCDISGVDVMVHAESGVPYVLEVNRAPEIDENDELQSGLDFAALIVDLYESRYAGRNG